MGLTIILVTHDLGQIGHYADRLACLHRTIHWHERADRVTAEEIREAISCELDEFLAYGRRLAERSRHRPPPTDGGAEEDRP
jgi:zinc transport system ATP-binding protein